MDKDLELYEEQSKLEQYLLKWVPNFDPADRDYVNIKDRLSLNVKGKVKIGGFLVLPLIGAFIGVTLNGFYLLMNFSLYSLLGIALIGGLVLFQGASIFFMLKRNKLAKWTFVSSYVLLVAISVLGGTNEFIASIVWGLYFLLSKRVQYTFVESFAPRIEDDLYY